MRSVLLDRLYQKRYTFSIYLVVALLLSTVLFRKAEPIQSIVSYFFLCFFWNHLVKSVGVPRNMDLIWSLPLKERDLLIGTSLGLLILGWAMNILLFLYARLYLNLPWMLLLSMCALQLFTDLLQQAMSYGTKDTPFQNYSILILWVGLPFLLIFLGKDKLANFFTWLMGLSPYYLMSIALLFYLAMSYLLLLNIRRIRRKMIREN